MYKKRIRIHKKHSAFVYAILESLEGMVSFSTVSELPAQQHRDLELVISPHFIEEVNFILESFKKKFELLEI